MIYGHNNIENHNMHWLDFSFFRFLFHFRLFAVVASSRSEFTVVASSRSELASSRKFATLNPIEKAMSSSFCKIFAASSAENFFEKNLYAIANV